MIVNKKFDRLRQYAKEKVGNNQNVTTSSDEFKALEMEMDLRQQGMDRLSLSSTAYIKSLSARTAGDPSSKDRDKLTPLAYFGATLTQHGDDFEPASDFGACLTSLGRANERLARLQETYAANATSSWLESVERSQIQMKEYQTARKRLDSRRLAYDTVNAKTQRMKREDFRVEEELRSQKAKYEESYEEVVRRMGDIKEAEEGSVADLGSMLDAELAYYDRCREILVQVRRDWPAGNVGAGGYGSYASSAGGRSDTASPAPTMSRRNTGTLTRSRAGSNTTTNNGYPDDGGPLRPTLSMGSTSSRIPSGANTPSREMPGFELPSRPGQQRSASTNLEVLAGGGGGHEQPPRLARVPTEPSQNQILGAKNSLRGTGYQREDAGAGAGVFGDDSTSEVSDAASSYGGGGANGWRSGSMVGQDGSATTAAGAGNGKKMAPPPPPPSRSKKPPPPPPMKRSALSTSDVLNY